MMTDISISIDVEEVQVQTVEDGVMLSVQEAAPILVEIAGGQGEPGPPGSGGETDIHEISVASATWVITHNWPGGYPSVTAVDTSGKVMIGEVAYLSPTQLEIRFSSAFSGKVYLN